MYDRIAEIELTSGKDDSGLSGAPAWLLEKYKELFASDLDALTYVAFDEIRNVTFEKGNGRQGAALLNTLETEAGFKDVFSVRMLQGSRERAAHQRNSVILTRSAAQHLYGGASPLGKTLRLNHNEYSFGGLLPIEKLESVVYTIVGVMDDLPANTSFCFLRPLDALFLNDEVGTFALSRQAPNRTGGSLYALLRPDRTLEEQNLSLVPERCGVDVFREMWYPKFTPIGQSYMERFSSIAWFYRSIGGLILLVALLNFFTFTNRSFLNRRREFHIRKSVGESRRQVFSALLSSYLFFLLPVLLLTGCCMEILQNKLVFRLGSLSVHFEPSTLYAQLGGYLLWGATVLLPCRLAV